MYRSHMIAIPADFALEPSSRCMSLTDMEKGQVMRVTGIAAMDGVPAETLRRLSELGFLPGEIVRIVAIGAIGREPIAVRVGTSTFALRFAEAQCVQVAPASQG